MKGFDMIQRFYVHNFRGLDNFELNTKGIQSVLLIGKNGTGKTSIVRALELLQRIARGTNRMRDLAERQDYVIGPKDFTRGRNDIPMRFEIEVLLEKKLFKYVLAFDLPVNFKDLRVVEEELSVDDKIIYSRQIAQVSLQTTNPKRETKFSMDWHLVALPVIQEQSSTDPIHQIRTWFAQMIILAPIPSKMTGESNDETFDLKKDGGNFAEWFSGLLSRYPAAYTHLEKYLHDVLPDMMDFINTPSGPNSKNMLVRFERKDAILTVDFNDLSDGEKCFFLCAVILAANKVYGPLFCFWDEPDNYLSLSEVGNFIVTLRNSFRAGGQIIITSHNPETIRRFSNENTFVLDRKSHLEPTIIRLLRDVAPQGDLVDTLIRGDLEL